MIYATFVLSAQLPGNLRRVSLIDFRDVTDEKLAYEN